MLKIQNIGMQTGLNGYCKNNNISFGKQRKVTGDTFQKSGSASKLNGGGNNDNTENIMQLLYSVMNPATNKFLDALDEFEGVVYSFADIDKQRQTGEISKEEYQIKAQESLETCEKLFDTENSRGDNLLHAVTNDTDDEYKGFLQHIVTIYGVNNAYDKLEQRLKKPNRARKTPYDYLAGNLSAMKELEDAKVYVAKIST